ncbi:MAG: imidazole glycerol phosphate synthase subunit HisH [Deferrisomatales bacterium]|nr:imidazole glycerol phosphate synthase subunit HisH [Deferrisomatales bacterium]
MDLVIIDYDSGNLRSVQKAFEHLGVNAVLSRDPGQIRAARAVVLPGQGAFRDCIRKLDHFGLTQIVRDKILEDVPFFGICVGYQLLFEESEEHGRTPGFGILKGKVVRFPHDLTRDGQWLKVPHMGWNQLQKKQDVDVLAGVADGDHVYFVHSYYPVPEEPEIVATTTEYGLEFASSVARGNLFASQFHPEKSQKVGLAILQAFWDKVKRLGS